MSTLTQDIERVLYAHQQQQGLERMLGQVRDAISICKLVESGVPVNLRTNVGLDIVSAGLLGFIQGGAGSTIGGSYTGTASAVSATTVTVPVNLPVNSIVGQIVVLGGVFGIAQSNTSVASSVITIDRWYDPNALPADPGVAAATTPATGVCHIIAGNAPASYLALADNASATAPAVTDTALTGEITTASGGLIRKLATYAHTASSAGSATITLTKTWTMNASDVSAGSPRVISQVGVFQGVVVGSSTSRLVMKTALNANATLTISGDQIQVTHSTGAT